MKQWNAILLRLAAQKAGVHKSKMEAKAVTTRVKPIATIKFKIDKSLAMSS
jgi:hypothetical protein